MMLKKNIKRIVLILSLIVFGIFCALSAFYLLKVKPELERRRQLEKEQSTAEAGFPESGIEQKVKKQQGAGALGFSDKQILSEGTFSVYKRGQQDKRKEGSLWVDHESLEYTVTLGTIHGLSPGRRLDVYDGDRKVGEVEVEISFDDISFVHPVSGGGSFLDNDYYRVVIKTP